MTKRFPYGGVVGTKGQICKFWSPFHQFGTGVARNFICGAHIYLGMSNLYGMTKYPKGATVGDGSRCQNCKFWNPFHTFGTGVVRNFKFGTRVDFGMSHLMADKIFPLRGVVGFPRLIISDPPKVLPYFAHWCVELETVHFCFY